MLPVHQNLRKNMHISIKMKSIFSQQNTTILTVFFLSSLLWGCTSNLNTQSTMSDSTLNKNISRSLKKDFPEYARLVMDSMTTLKPYELSVLTQHQVYQVEYLNPHRPVRFNLSYFPKKKQATILTAYPENLEAIFLSEKLQIDTGAEALELVKALLILPLKAKERLYFLNSVDDIRFRPNLEGDDVQKKEEILNTYREAIASPEAEKNDSGFEFTLYLISNTQLEQRDIFVSHNGTINQVVKVLEEDLPLPYIM